MYDHKKRRKLQVRLLGILLSLTIAFSGSMVAFTEPVEAASKSSSSVAKKVINTGKKYLKTPYKFGARSGRTSAFDCSSFTQYVYKQHGIKLPRSSRQQAKVGKYVSKKNLRAGDLVFSDTNRDGKINHVAIYMGNNRLLHTYKVGVGVTITKFKGTIWDKTHVTARRVIR